MEPKHFNLLAVTAVISLLAAGVVHSVYNDWSAEKISGAKLFPDLGDNANRIASVMIRKGNEKLTLKKTGTGWVLQERSGYPVKVDPVRQLVVGLTQAELVEPKTSVEKRYGLLELGDPASPDAKSTLVELHDASGGTLGNVVLGKRKVGAFGSGQAGTYVRKPGDPQTWLANENLRAPVSVFDWVDPVFFRIDPKHIKSLAVTMPNAPTYKLVVNDRAKNTFRFADVPQGLKLKSGVSPTGMVTSMKTLELVDVRKIDKLPSGKNVGRAILETVDGMKVEIRLRPDGADRWVALKVLDEGSKPKAAKKLDAAINGWSFKVADWRVRQTFKESKELFERVKPPAAKANDAGDKTDATTPEKSSAPEKPASDEPAKTPDVNAPSDAKDGPDPASGPDQAPAGSPN